jgi:tripartite-type tricarboxylate transporter receptor subunit TctC
METLAKSIRVLGRILTLTLLALAASPPSFGQAWPVKPIRLVVPFPPGGTGDLLGRLAARDMQAALGQTVVVENRAEYTAMVAADVARWAEIVRSANIRAD